MLLPFFKCILEVVFCEGDSASITSIVKMAAFQFHLQSEKQRKVVWLGDDSHVVFGKKFHGDKRSVTRCIVVKQQPVLLSLYLERSTRTFSRSRSKTSQQYAELADWPTRTNSLWTILYMSKKVMSILLTLLVPASSFSVSVSLDFLWFLSLKLV
jgi:hypothetical protein